MLSDDAGRAGANGETSPARPGTAEGSNQRIDRGKHFFNGAPRHKLAAEISRKLLKGKEVIL